jgi:hypothetical protein
MAPPNSLRFVTKSSVFYHKNKLWHLKVLPAVFSTAVSTAYPQKQLWAFDGRNGGVYIYGYCLFDSTRSRKAAPGELLRVFTTSKTGP